MPGSLFAATDAASADKHAAFRTPIEDVPPERLSEIRVIDWLFAIGPETECCIAIRLQPLQDALLQFET